MAMAALTEETIGFQSLRMRPFWKWLTGACRKWNDLRAWNVWISGVKGNALVLFHPTASSVLSGAGFIIATYLIRRSVPFLGISATFPMMAQFRKLYEQEE
jgi:hypothetical protein